MKKTIKAWAVIPDESYSTAHWRLVILREIWDKTNGLCGYCKKRLLYYSDMTIDHIIPKSRGGKDIISNMIIACADCNNKKDDKINFSTGERSNGGSTESNTGENVVKPLK